MQMLLRISKGLADCTMGVAIVMVHVMLAARMAERQLRG